MILRKQFLRAMLAAASVLGFSQIAEAQSNIYSGNIVGYVNVYFTNGLRFIANPLSHVQTNGTVNNWLTNIITTCPNGTEVYVWDLAQQAFSPPATFEAGTGWNLNHDLPPGKGFVVQSTASWTNTFVGEVMLGTTTNFVAGSNRFSLLASKLPQAGSLSSNLVFPEIEGASVFLFRQTDQRYSDAFSCFEGLGWYDPHGVAGVGGPHINVAESFLVQNPGVDVNWVRTFYITNTAAAQSIPAFSESSQAPAISSLLTRAGKVTLQIRDPGRRAYDIAFSSDGRSWNLIAKNRTGPAWTGAAGGTQGFYRLVTR